MSPVFQREQNAQEGQHQACLHTLWSTLFGAHSLEFGNPTDHLHWQNCHTKQEFAPSSFHKGMPTEIGSRFEPLAATEEWAARLRSWTACAHVPALPPQILGAFAGLLPWHSWERLKRCPGPKGRVSELHRMSGCSLSSGHMLVMCCKTSSSSRRQFCWCSWVFAPGTQHKEKTPGFGSLIWNWNSY